MSSKKVVCVIDDDASVRRTLCSQLEAAGFQTVEAVEGTSGMAAVRQTNPSVVVVDIIMPEREGLSTIKEIKEKHPATRILAISGGGIGDADRYLQFALSLGADDTLTKPFRMADLIERVQRLAAK